ncbi:hypothetical protein AVEN_162133-1 [Araneus ventricosus]|uniref:Uncharacterized protein n=1 Tax=Araneus ventricosus TaxID=182803 RepID=A0A4Y2NSZ3_ARAVE|nr:hypothetical protein AVEN_162133-1 [Araneus ventricosus]
MQAVALYCVLAYRSLFGLVQKPDETIPAQMPSDRSLKLRGAKKNIPEINRKITYVMRSVGDGLENGKVIDVEVLSKVCRNCSLPKGLQNGTLMQLH